MKTRIDLCCLHAPGGWGGGGVLLGILCVGVPPVLQILSQFQTKNVIFHTRFQTRPLTSIPVLRPHLWAEIMLSLLRLERDQKHYSIPFWIRIFFFLSYSFRIEAINRFRHSVVPSKTISDSRPKWAKSMSVFRPKRRKKPYPMGRHIPKWLI